MTVEERFEAKYIPEPMSGCFLWIGATTGQYPWLYGQMGIGSKKEVAHRISWILAFGKIPLKMKVLHKCDLTLCVNPHHLFCGTAQDNSDDMVKKQRSGVPWTARLTISQVQEMRSLAKRGLGNRRLAKRFGIDQAHAWRIIKYKMWKRIPDA